MKLAKILAVVLCMGACPAWAQQSTTQQRAPVPGVAANLPRDITTATVLSPEPAPTAPKGWRPIRQIGVPATLHTVRPASAARAASPVRSNPGHSATPQP